MQTLSFRNTSRRCNQDASLYGAICEVHPVPNNLNQVKKMYEFLKDLLREKQLLSY